MTFYEKEILRIRKEHYANQGQINTVVKTKNFIEGNFEKELNLNLLSHIGFASKFHLLRLFKRYYGQTPQQYLTDIRLEKSRTFLQQGMTVSETCFCVGFECPSSFSTLFRRRHGLAPLEFQKRATFAK